MNVFEFALQMEQDGKRFYEKLAAESNITELKSIFNLLASSEDEHARTIEQMKKETPRTHADSKLIENVKNVFQPLLDRKDVIETLTRDHEGCRRAISLEIAAIKLYDKMAGMEPDPEVAENLTKLANEERMHLEIMENIYDFMEAPHDYLAWGEFSNLREF